mmetsp:Transcript_10763/g.16174  ORF Transcript_10763/g.16174 Transcript_10763/m.16174 type:complete len:274 (+) Transcript_10763:361-1182(+)
MIFIIWLSCVRRRVWRAMVLALCFVYASVLIVVARATSAYIFTSDCAFVCAVKGLVRCLAVYSACVVGMTRFRAPRAMSAMAVVFEKQVGVAVRAMLVTAQVKVLPVAANAVNVRMGCALNNWCATNAADGVIFGRTPTVEKRKNRPRRRISWGCTTAKDKWRAWHAAAQVVLRGISLLRVRNVKVLVCNIIRTLVKWCKNNCFATNVILFGQKIRSTIGADVATRSVSVATKVYFCNCALSTIRFPSVRYATARVSSKLRSFCCIQKTDILI